ncbi:unnamed protein product [Echinostoma caproni]|uniref:Uncharacterized protein n=1 Tax=Echinostoma caproni TaxID=27848 RepID=A0A183BGF9_9TREM|nr:unnamed protein product [Echinostoma caproni]
MVEITDLRDATVHQIHIDQIHFNETPTPIEDPADETQENPSCDTPPTTTEDQTQQPSTPETFTDENTPLALRRPIRRARQPTRRFSKRGVVVIRIYDITPELEQRSTVSGHW